MIILNNNSGGFGNQMFQYCFARLLAEVNQFNINTSFLYQDVVATTPHKVFPEPEISKTVTIDDNFYYHHRLKNGSYIPQLSPDCNYLISGYFQDADLYNNHEDLVRSFFNIPTPEQNTIDTLVTIRLGDFIHSGYNSEIIHYDWYNEVLETAPGKKYLLICDFKNRPLVSTEAQEDTYINKIMTPDSIVIRGTDLKKDFEMRLSFDNIICSNSTFSWWGCFLGTAKNITTFRDFGFFGPDTLTCHGDHINNLSNIRNTSTPVKGKMINIATL